MPRTFGRAFPDANQAGVADGVVINQSRLTFTGQRGIVYVWWGMQMVSASGVQKNIVGIRRSGTAIALGDVVSFSSVGAVANERVGAMQVLVFVNPAVGSFIELLTRLSNDVIDLAANDGFVTGMTFGFDDAEGPTVTIS